MNILLAADGSAYTKKAVKYLVSHLNSFQGEPALHVLYVHPPVPKGWARSVAGRAAVDGYYKEEASAALAPAEKHLRKHGIPFQGSYVIGDIAEEIQAYVKKHKIDLIVMGSHGHTALQNLVMGSVTTRVLATTTVPVLIVR